LVLPQIHRVIGFTSNPKACIIPYVVNFLSDGLPVTKNTNKTISLYSEKPCGVPPSTGLYIWTFDFKQIETINKSYSENVPIYRSGKLIDTVTTSYNLAYSSTVDYLQPYSHYYSWTITQIITINGYTETFTTTKQGDTRDGTWKMDAIELNKVEVDSGGNTVFFFYRHKYDGVFVTTNTSETITYDVDGVRTHDVVAMADTSNSYDLHPPSSGVFTSTGCPYSGDIIWPNPPYIAETYDENLTYNKDQLLQTNWNPA